MSLDETSQKKSASIGLNEWNFLSNLGITADTWNSIASLGNSISRKISSTLAYFKAQRDERKALNLSESASQDTVRIEASARDLDIVNKVRKAEPVKGTPFFGQVLRGDLMYLSNNGGYNA
jgi:hypothetical protein